MRTFICHAWAMRAKICPSRCHSVQVNAIPCPNPDAISTQCDDNVHETTDESRRSEKAKEHEMESLPQVHKYVEKNNERQVCKDERKIGRA